MSFCVILHFVFITPLFSLIVVFLGLRTSPLFFLRLTRPVNRYQSSNLKRGSTLPSVTTRGSCDPRHQSKHEVFPGRPRTHLSSKPSGLIFGLWSFPPETLECYSPLPPALPSTSQPSFIHLNSVQILHIRCPVSFLTYTHYSLPPISLLRFQSPIT